MASQFPVPEFFPCSSAEADICFVLGEVENPPKAHLYNGINWWSDGNTFFLDVKETSKYLAKEGTEVIVQPYWGEVDNSVRVFLLSSVFSALLYMRGIPPLHASCIQTDKGAILFTGSSGIGKSTLAASFHSIGYKLLSDDICAIRISDGGGVIAYPFYPRLKLWSSSVDLLGLRIQDLTQVRSGIDKYYLSLGSSYYEHPLPVHRVFVLGPVDPKLCEMFSITDIHGASKVAFLKCNLYRKGYLDIGIGDKEITFKTIVELAVSSRVSILNRSLLNYSLTDTAFFLERAIFA